MPFPFAQHGSPPEQPITSRSIGARQFVRSAFDVGGRFSVMAAIGRMREFDAAATGRLLEPDEANELYGMEGLSFEGQIHEGQAKLMRKRKEHELRFDAIYQQGAKGAGRFALGMGASMVASLANPLDMAVGFVPVVGAPGRAAEVGRVASTGIRGAVGRAVARGGIIPAEAIAKLPVIGRYPGTAAAIVEGTVGQAIAEIPVALANFQDQSNYTGLDAAVNIAGAGALSGGLRAALSGAARVLSRMTDEGHIKAQNMADVQLIESRNPINVRSVVETDPGTLAYRAEVEERLSWRNSPEGRASREQDVLRAVDEEVSKQRGEIARSLKERHVNEADLVALAEAELTAAKEAGQTMAQEVIDLNRALFEHKRAKSDLERPRKTETRSRPQKRQREEIRQAQQRLDTATQNLADVFGLAYVKTAKKAPKVFDSIADRNKWDFTVAKHLPATIRDGLSAANRAEINRRFADNELQRRLALRKTRYSAEALQRLDEQFKQEAESTARVYQEVIESRVPSEREQRYYDVSDGEEMQARIEEDVNELMSIAGIESFERTSTSDIEEILTTGGVCLGAL